MKKPPTDVSHETEEEESSYVTTHPEASRIVILHGDVNEQTTAQIVASFLHLANINHEPIKFVISTRGGTIDEMFSVCDVMRFLPCPVHTIGLGKIMSAGVLMLASGEKGNRLIGASARVMVHSVSGGIAGNVFEQIAEANETKRLQELMVTLMVKETKMSRAQVENMMSSGHDCYLSAKDAVKLGIVDKIIGA